MHLSVLYVYQKKYNYQKRTAIETETENVYCAVPAEYLNIIQIIFTKNRNQLFIFSLISNMFRPDLLDIFGES